MCQSQKHPTEVWLADGHTTSNSDSDRDTGETYFQVSIPMCGSFRPGWKDDET
jgi:hypothetical protein